MESVADARSPDRASSTTPRLPPLSASAPSTSTLEAGPRMSSASSSAFPFTFRVDSPLDSTPGSSSSLSSGGEGRARPLSREDKARLRDRRRSDRSNQPATDDLGGREEKKRGWMDWGVDQTEEDADEPPNKKRRGIAATLVDSAVSVALVGTAVGLTAYRMWRDRGKPVPPDELPRITAPPDRPHILAAGPVESHIYAQDHGRIDHSLEGERRVDRGSIGPPPAYYRAESFVTAPSTPAFDLALRSSPFDQLYPNRTPALPTTSSRPTESNTQPRRPPLLPSTSSFLPPTGLDSHIDNLNSKLEQMMEEARLALLAPTSHFAEDPPPPSEDLVMIQEETSDGGWQDLGAAQAGPIGNLGQAGSSRMRESFSMPSFTAASSSGSTLPRSVSTMSGSTLSSSLKAGRSTTTRTGGHVAHTSKPHGRHRSVASLPTSSSATTQSTPMRYRRDLLVGQSSSGGGIEENNVMFVQPERDEEAVSEVARPSGGGNSLKEMLARTARSYGVTLTE